MPTTITQSLIDFALSPPLGVLKPHLDGNGPYGPGNHSLTGWLNAGVASDVRDTFGVMVQFNGAIPAGLGRILGFDDGGLVVMDEFTDRLVQLVVLHEYLGGGFVASQVEDLRALPFMVRWAEALPAGIGLYVNPDISVDLFYLLVG